MWSLNSLLVRTFLTTVLSEQFMRRSCKRKDVPCASRASLSISPKRMPPCLLRPWHKVNCGYLNIHSTHGFSGIIDNTVRGTFARLLTVQFTSNEGMSNDVPHVSVNLRWTTTSGTTSPTLCEQCVGSLTSHRIYYMCKPCEMGPTVYRPNPRLESLIV